MQIKKLTIIVPVYNEENTITEILDQVREVQLLNDITKEIIIVNDASIDETEARVIDYTNRYPEASIQYFRHEKNLGKGAAVRTGIQYATGEFLIVQDADLEYDPREYNIMLEPVVDGKADVVYGSRFLGSRPRRTSYFWHMVGNNLLTFISNVFTDLSLSDIGTCYKLFNTEQIKSIELKEHGFSFELEVTAKLVKIPEIRIYEVGVSYYGRTFREGKKLKWVNIFQAFWSILKYNLFTK